MNRTLLTTAIILLNAINARADRTAPFASVKEDTYFQVHELSLDLYGTVRDNGHLGMGAGANYFFTRLLGAGIETRFEKVDWPNQIVVSLFARYPIEQWHLAPYAYGGGGRQFRDGSQWLGHIGGGVDYRFTRCVGVFGDVRETFAESSKDFTLWRFGLRLLF